jgi:predicted alpha/beta-fold hydrolase
MKYLGKLGKENKPHGITAAACISPAFDVLASGVTLKHTALGMIDSSMLGDLKSPFLTKRYHTDNKCKDDLALKAEKAQTCIEFDGLTRARILGRNSAHMLWRSMSCDQYLPHVGVPFLTVVAKDDPITEYRHVPVETLQRNPHSLLTVFERGGHVNFYHEDGDTSCENRSINFALGYLE